MTCWMSAMREGHGATESHIGWCVAYRGHPLPRPAPPSRPAPRSDKPIDLWQRVRVREHSGGLVMRDLRRYRIGCEKDALNLLFVGNTNRVVADTPMNHASSRSHCIFSLALSRRDGDSDVVRESKLLLVDLAGSERIYKTGMASGGAPGITSMTGVTVREGKFINLSLHHLEQVILALQAAGARGGAAVDATVSGVAGGEDTASVVTHSTALSRPTVSTGGVGGGGVRGRPEVGRSPSPSHTPSPRPAAGGIALSRPPSRGPSGLSAHTRTPSAASSAEASRRTSLGGGDSVGAPPPPPTTTTTTPGAGGSTPHIPYRNSMLTSVLREALGGNCRTVLVATLNPEPQYAEETVSTCRFAARCATLQTRVSVHQVRDPAVTIALLRERNRVLAARVAALEAPTSSPPPSLAGAGGGGPSSASSARLQVLPVARLQELERRIAAYLRHVASLPAAPPLAAPPAATVDAPTPPPSAPEASITVRLSDGLPEAAAGDATSAPLRALADIASHLRLTDLTTAYATCHLLFTALARAVAVAGEATSAVDFERARLQGALAGLASATSQAQRLGREVAEWESRHGTLCSEHEHVLLRCQQLQRDCESLKAASAPAPHHALVEEGTGGGDGDVTDLPPQPRDGEGMRISGGADELGALPHFTPAPGEADVGEGGRRVRDDGGEGEDGDAMSTTVDFSLVDTAGAPLGQGGRLDSHGVDVGRLPGTDTGADVASVRAPRRHLSITSLSSRPSTAGRPGAADATTSQAVLASLTADVSRLMAAKAARDLVVSGSVFVKHGRRGRPHIRFVWVDADGLAVHWRPVGKDRSSAGSAARESMLLTACIDVVPGRRTAVFARSTSTRDDACWSIIAYDRTLDLEVHWPQAGEDHTAVPAVTSMERQLRDKWVAAFRLVLAAAHAAAPPRAAVPSLMPPAAVVTMHPPVNANLAASMVERSPGDEDEDGMAEASAGVVEDDLDSASVAESMLPPPATSASASGAGVGAGLRLMHIAPDGAKDPMLSALVAVLERQDGAAKP